ncbi:MAG: membrane protein insertase YidC [Flavobacteriales bacterium]|nr:membrane protein insertase YidC [Flavobacteriales bacterium]|tara:strand:- start:6434 stop:8296 length:1863 start_codon:yes stop_codon:yes gene_type:complete
MEEEKFDPYKFIGVILIAMILTWMLFRNESVSTQNIQSVESNTNKSLETEFTSNDKDSQRPKYSGSATYQENNVSETYGVFSSWLEVKDVEKLNLENKNLKIIVSSKGANLSLVNLKQFSNHIDQPLNLISENNHLINTVIKTRLGLLIETKNIYFNSSKTENNDKSQSLILRANISKNQFLEFKYTLPNEGYKFDFEIRSEGLEDILSSDNIIFEWGTDLFRNSKSIDYESRYTQLTYAYEEDKVDNLSLSGEDDDIDKDIRWISYRQHFFSSILIPEKIIDEVSFKSNDLTIDDKLDSRYTKKLYSAFNLGRQNGNILSKMSFYFGPTDYQILKSYGDSLETSVPLGWGIFGWINRFIFLPLFGWLATFLPYGIAIIVLTIIVRLVMSPVVYKSYVSQIKMKTLKPEIEELTKKFKNDAVKKQQETMSLYSKAGVNPMSGCIPALIQLPIFYALFSFFPVAFELRQKSFLWAEDLSSYDSIFELPFSIPFYGDHISLFPILASAAIFVYTLMTTGQQTMPQQEGMPNMKFIIYMMPLMMLLFFNNYASGLSLYYFISNTLTILLMLVIKNFIIKEDKIRAQIAENKKKPQKAGGFSQRLQKAMEAAEAQKKLNQKRRK